METDETETAKPTETGDDVSGKTDVSTPAAKSHSVENTAIVVGGVLMLGLIGAMGGLFVWAIRNEEQATEYHRRVMKELNRQSCTRVGPRPDYASRLDLQSSYGARGRFCPVAKETNISYHIVNLKAGIHVLCDSQTDGGGWVVFQRRRFKTPDSKDFKLVYYQYVWGFGEPMDNFWLGLENIHYWCNPSKRCELRIDAYLGGRKLYAKYQSFYIGDETSGYDLHVSVHSGTLEDHLKEVNGAKFTTRDIDRDNVVDRNCAHLNNGFGGWWYKGRLCSNANPNGEWGSNTAGSSATWLQDGKMEMITYIEMKFRK